MLTEADDQYPTTIAFCKLAILTGWRKSEIEGLEWSQVNLDRSTVVFDDSKEGLSIRPIGAPVVSLLRELTERSRGSYVLPTLRKSEHFGGGYKAFKRLCSRAGIEDVSPHTARHTLITKGQEELGYSESLCGAVVGHRNSHTVTGGYTHFAPAFLIEVADAITSEIARIMGFDDLLPAPDSP